MLVIAAASRDFAIGRLECLHIDKGAARETVPRWVARSRLRARGSIDRRWVVLSISALTSAKGRCVNLSGPRQRSPLMNLVALAAVTALISGARRRSLVRHAVIFPAQVHSDQAPCAPFDIAGPQSHFGIITGNRHQRVRHHQLRDAGIGVRLRSCGWCG
jgi:hypothetical protein